MRRFVVAALVLLASARGAGAWGFVTHRIIVENAAAAMPSGMAGFLKANVGTLSDAAIEPDSLLRDRDGEKEARRHYLDLDALSRPPFRDLPFDRDKAEELYGEANVKEAGLLPWRILEVLDQLREAFKKKDWPRVVSRSGWLSHYVADAYQPLHLTKNFDGQESCNQGVHAAFETDLIDRLKTRYRQETAPSGSFVPEVVREPKRAIFAEILGNYPLAGEILKADTEAVGAVKKLRKDYYDEMEREVGALARRQMTRAATMTANLWYTAWFQSGRPDLPSSAVPRLPREGRP